MVFMKAFVSLAVAAVMATSGDAAISATDLNASEKTRFCSAIISDSAYRKEANTVCDKYKYTLPRPRVYNACRAGLNAAEKEACAYAVSDKGSTKKCKDITKAQPLSTKFQPTCAKHWRTAPRPTVGAACQEGFDKVAVKMCNFVVFTLNSYDDAEDELVVSVEEAAPEEVVAEAVVEEAAAEVPEPVAEEEAAVEVPLEEPVVAEVEAVAEEAVVEVPLEEPVVAEVEAVAEEAVAEEDTPDVVEDAVERLTEMLDVDEQ